MRRVNTLVRYRYLRKRRGVEYTIFETSLLVHLHICDCWGIFWGGDDENAVGGEIRDHIFWLGVLGQGVLPGEAPAHHLAPVLRLLLVPPLHAHHHLVHGDLELVGPVWAVSRLTSILLSSSLVLINSLSLLLNRSS